MLYNDRGLSKQTQVLLDSVLVSPNALRGSRTSEE